MRKYLATAILFGLAACGENTATAPQPETAGTETPAVETAETTPQAETTDTSETARCVIVSGGEKTEMPCTFTPDGGGSFALSDLENGELVSGVTMISVSIFAKGEAEVRGLTTDGINSRWGIATRSETDPACWVGSDFEVCAY